MTACGQSLLYYKYDNLLQISSCFLNEVTFLSKIMMIAFVPFGNFTEMIKFPAIWRGEVCNENNG